MLRRGISNAFKAERILQINRENVRFMELYDEVSNFAIFFLSEILYRFKINHSSIQITKVKINKLEIYIFKLKDKNQINYSTLFSI